MIAETVEETLQRGDFTVRGGRFFQPRHKRRNPAPVDLSPVRMATRIAHGGKLVAGGRVYFDEALNRWGGRILTLYIPRENPVCVYVYRGYRYVCCAQVLFWEKNDGESAAVPGN